MKNRRQTVTSKVGPCTKRVKGADTIWIIHNISSQSTEWVTSDIPYVRYLDSLFTCPSWWIINHLYQCTTTSTQHPDGWRPAGGQQTEGGRWYRECLQGRWFCYTPVSLNYVRFQRRMSCYFSVSDGVSCLYMWAVYACQNQKRNINNTLLITTLPETTHLYNLIIAILEQPSAGQVEYWANAGLISGQRHHITTSL